MRQPASQRGYELSMGLPSVGVICQGGAEKGSFVKGFNLSNTVLHTLDWRRFVKILPGPARGWMIGFDVFGGRHIDGFYVEFV